MGMYQSFDAFEYVEYLRRRWLVVAVACAVAIALSLTLSLLLPKRYTATASIVIEPPGGADSRSATVVSPVYLESLKTYEHFAASDSLFVGAAEHFHLLSPAGSQAIESLKRGILKVSKIRDTKILEISATLQDPKLAQSFAQYVAEETVNMNRGANLVADREFLDDAEKRAAEAQQQLDKAQKAQADITANALIGALQADLDASVELQTKLKQDLVDAEANVAEYQQQQGPADGQFAREQLQAARARVTLLEKRSQELAQSIREKGALVAKRTAKRDEVLNELRMTQAAYDNAIARLRDLRAAVGTRGERLRVMDPGIVPQRPSSPNIPLNVVAALLVALVACIVYLSFAFSFRRRSVGFEPAVSRGMRG
jgi:capsular polysaccharide biosynthesis protein